MGGKSIEQGPITPAGSGFPGPTYDAMMPAMGPGEMQAMAQQIAHSMGVDPAAVMQQLQAQYPGASFKTFQPMPGLMPPGTTAPSTPPPVMQNMPPQDMGFMSEPYDSMSFHPNRNRR